MTFMAAALSCYAEPMVAPKSRPLMTRRVQSSRSIRSVWPAIGAIRQTPLLDSYGVTATGAVLVRPDAFVAWRAKEAVAQTAETLANVLYRVLSDGRTRDLIRPPEQFVVPNRHVRSGTTDGTRPRHVGLPPRATVSGPPRSDEKGQYATFSCW
jgi:hypothetical protein